jgi:hypothetical protein
VLLRAAVVTGLLPGIWGNMSQLTSITLRNVSFSMPATLPAAWGSAQSFQMLQTFTMENVTGLSGSVPANWSAGFPALSSVQWSNVTTLNSTLGELLTVFDQVGRTNPMIMLQLSGMRLSGTLPTTWKASRWVLVTWWMPFMCYDVWLDGPSSLPAARAGADMCSCIVHRPDNFLNLHGLRCSVLTLPHLNNLSCRVITLDVSRNLITSQLPASMVDGPLLMGVNISSNHLSGTLPAAWAGWRWPLSLDVSNNTNITGHLPPSWGAAANGSTSRLQLVLLNASFCNLTGGQSCG